jgi:aminopeptidase N
LREHAHHYAPVPRQNGPVNRGQEWPSEPSRRVCWPRIERFASSLDGTKALPSGLFDPSGEPSAITALMRPRANHATMAQRYSEWAQQQVDRAKLTVNPKARKDRLALAEYYSLLAERELAAAAERLESVLKRSQSVANVLPLFQADSDLGLSGGSPSEAVTEGPGAPQSRPA